MDFQMLTLDDVAEALAVSSTQARQLVKRGDLPAGKIGGRGRWRIKASDLEEYVERTWSQTRAEIEAGSDSSEHEPESEHQTDV